FRKISVSVLGQVVRPGIYALRPGATVLEALSAAGGLTEMASVTEARLVRASGENQPLALDDLLIRQDMQYNVALQPGDALLVQPGDILVVPQTGLVNVSSVASILAGLALFFR